MRDLIDYLKTEFDTVILDCPPFGPIIGRQILTTTGRRPDPGGALRQDDVREHREGSRILDRNKLLGVVFNDVKSLMFNTQYDYRYYHYKHRAHYPYKGPAPTKKQKTYLDS